MSDYNYLLKNIIVGDSGVGKSNILIRFIKDEFMKEHQITIGVEFGFKMMKKGDKLFKVQIWDTVFI